jgi:hypothetical protein
MESSVEQTLNKTIRGVQLGGPLLMQSFGQGSAASGECDRG